MEYLGTLCLKVNYWCLPMVNDYRTGRIIVRLGPVYKHGWTEMLDT